jgi:predicted small secreted protein
MKQDEMDNLLNKEFIPEFNEQIPDNFLLDINERLDELERKKKRKVFFIWFFSLISLFGAISLGYFMSKMNSGKIILKDKELTNYSSQSNKLKNKITKQDSSKKSMAKTLQFINETTFIESNLTGIQYSKYGTSEDKIIMQTNLNESKEILSNVSDQSVFSDVVSENQSIQISEFTENIISSSKLDSFKIEDQDKEEIKDSIVEISKIIIPELTNENKAKDLNRFSIGLFTGISGIFSSIDLNTNQQTLTSVSNLKVYKETRRQQERMTSSWDLELRFQMIHKNIIYQTGIEFFEWGEQIIYDYNSISGINRFSYLNIPLRVGYQFQKANYSVNPFAGISLGYGFKREGIYLNPDLNSVSVVKSQKAISNIEVGTQLSFHLDNTTFSFVPIYRMSIGPVVNEGIFRNNYKSIGFQIGVSYRL